MAVSTLRSLIFTRTSKDTTVVFLATAVNIFAAGLFFVFAPRILGPSDFGIFATVVATGILATNIANFGIDTGILRFASGDARNNSYLALAFKSYLILGAAAAIIGFVISPFLANLLGHYQLVPLLRIAFFSIIFILFTNFYVAALQAKKQFIKASIVNISSNLSKLVLLAVAAVLFSVGLYIATVIFFFTTIVSVIVGRLLLPFEIKAKGAEKPFAFFNYNLWVALSLIIASIPLDNYFLLKIAGPVQTGLYAAPFKILTFVYQFAGNFTRVLAPRFSSFDTDKKAKTFAFKSFGIVIMMTFALIVLAFLGTILIRLVFGTDYIPSGQIFKVLSIGFIFFFASTVPSAIILYYFGKSQITFFVTLIRLVVFLTLLYFLVPKMQAVGAAVSYSIAEGMTFLFLASYSFWRLK